MSDSPEIPLDSTTEFMRRVYEEWLPIFCNTRGYPLEGFTLGKKRVSPLDARDFLRALPFITVNERGQYSMPRSAAKEAIFWEWLTNAGERRVTLSIESIVTIAAIARLHLDYGWPAKCLGIQSEKWAFDLTAFMRPDSPHEYIAGEVKSTSTGLNGFLENLKTCCAEGPHECDGRDKNRINAHKKWIGLIKRRPAILWALGPNGDSRVFTVFYNDNATIQLQQTTDEALRFPSGLEGKPNI